MFNIMKNLELKNDHIYLNDLGKHWVLCCKSDPWEYIENLSGEKNDIQYYCRQLKIIIMLQIRLEMALFSKLENFKCTSLINKLLYSNKSFSTYAFFRRNIMQMDSGVILQREETPCPLTLTDGLYSITTVLLQGWFGIKLLLKVDMPLNKETNQNTDHKEEYMDVNIKSKNILIFFRHLIYTLTLI